MGFVQELYQVYLHRQSIKRKYAAAKNSATLGIPSNNGSGTVNDEIETSWQEVTERTLALVRDFPIFAGAVNSMEAFVVADGIRPQVDVKKADGTPDVEKSKEIEQAFNTWADDPEQCDTAGKMTFWEQMALTERMEGEFGEFIVMDTITPRGGYTISAVEPLNLSDNGFSDIKAGKNGSVIWRGIEYNPKNQKVLAYHFKDPSDANSLFRFDTIRVPAKRIQHGFKTIRAGQMRGISPFASAILSAYSLRDYMGSELAAQNMSSKWMAWVTAPPSGNYQDQSSRNNVEYNDAYSNYVKTLDHASIEYLKNGESVTVNTQQRQSNSFQAFNEIIIRYISASTGLPYELLSQDYSGLNFTTLRAVRNDFKQQLRPKWSRKKSQFCQPVFNKWLRMEVLKGGLNLPGYFENPKKYENVRWITPTLEQIDPMKEFGAELLKVNAGMKSPQMVIKDMGGDPEKILGDFEIWKAQTDAKDLAFPALTSNIPAISNFGIIEAEEEEVVEEVAPVKKADPKERMGQDAEGNVYRMENGVWKALE